MTRDESTLYYATEFKGLAKLNLRTREHQFIKFEGIEVGNLNSVAIDDENGVVYVTDSGPIPFSFSAKIVLLSLKTGKIIKYETKTEKASILEEGIFFPNGITYEQKTHSLIYIEFNRFRIWKYDLATNRKRLLVENLFGYGDNLKLTE